MKKDILNLICGCLLLAVLSGCGQDKSTTSNGVVEQKDGISVVSTIFAPYDFIREITGDNAEITMLLPPGSESHSFEPTPQDIIKIQNSDVFIYVGGESDEWVGEVLESMDTSKMKIVTLMDCVEVVEEEVVEGMEEEHEDEEEGDHEEVELDEHVWTSPKNAKRIVQKIADTLCQVDEANAKSYKEKTTGYLAKLDQLDEEFQGVVASADHKTLIFGDRFPFRYLADAYDLSYFAAFPGCSTETEASAATVAFLIDKVKAENIPAVFYVELSNAKMANTISEATGAKVLLLHACHNITKAEFESGVSYIDLMKQNVENLKEALG